MNDEKMIHGMTLREWKDKYPLLPTILDQEVTFWFNPKLERFDFVKNSIKASKEEIEVAEQRWNKFASWFQTNFPETSPTNGRIQSALHPLSQVFSSLERIGKTQILGKKFAKLDSNLPVAGSIKARGGIYEVLKITDTLLAEKWNYAKENNDTLGLDLNDPKFKKFFHDYTISVGSTGNLGMSIGIIAQKFGFRTKIYMSNDAKQWKKDKLKKLGVEIVEIHGNYTEAVALGRTNAEKDPFTYFIDDEHSKELFYGYSTAALELKKQLDKQSILVDADHPLFVYLPCGVGTSPGGITFGLKTLFGDNVHCFYMEPANTPSMLLGLLTGKYNEISIEDFDISAFTEADGLACPRPARFISEIVSPLVSGIYTVKDEDLFALLALLWDTEQIKIEPSSAGALLGPIHLFQAERYSQYLQNHGILQKMDGSTHVVWFTGGIFLPEAIWDENYKKGATSVLYQMLH